MPAYGLGAFTEGLTSGIETRSKMDFQRQYTERMRQLNAEKQLELGGKYHEARGDYLTKHPGQEAEFDRIYGKKYQPAGDPAGIRMFKWLGQKMGFGQPDEEALPKQKPVVKETKYDGFADGGAVQDRFHSGVSPRKYGCGGRVRKYEDGGRVHAGQRGLGDEEYAAQIREEREQRAREHDEYEGVYGPAARERAGGALYEAMQDVEAAEGGAETGRAHRRALTTAVAGGADIVAGYGRDILSPIWEGVEYLGGVAGIGGEEEAVPTPETTAPTTPTTPAVDTPADKKGAVDDAVGDEAPSEAIAGKAVAGAEADALRNLDYSNLAAQGVRPADLPSMNTADWGEHRRERFLGMKMQGMSTREAYEAMDMEVIETQIRGFNHELSKAFQYLQTGQSNAAMLAMTMAYQYFPNGSNVEFAAMDDPKTGRPVLVARGVSEETGEPVGSPQIITAERINMMRAAATDPDKWRVWTKDSRDLQLEIAKLGETKEHHRAMEDIYAYEAETERREAAALPTGLKSPEQRARGENFDLAVKDLAMQDPMFESPQIQEQLAAYMADLQDMYPQSPDRKIISVVLDAYRLGEQQGPGGGLEAVRATLDQATARE